MKGDGLDLATPMETDDDPTSVAEAGVVAMDVDSTQTPLSGPAASAAASALAKDPLLAPLTAEDAQNAIEMLRGDDVAGRVAAASRLEGVAAALGEERTKEVRQKKDDNNVGLGGVVGRAVIFWDLRLWHDFTPCRVDRTPCSLTVEE